MSRREWVGETPVDLVSRCADIALDAAQRYAQVNDADVVKALVLLVIEGQPDGETDATTAALGFDDHSEAVIMLGHHLTRMAGILGLDIRIIEVEKDRR